MKFLDYIYELHQSVEQFMSIEWTIGTLLIVVFIVVVKYHKLFYLALRTLFNARAVYKYFFDKSVKVRGESFLLSFNNSVTIDEKKQLKKFESLTKIKLHRNNEKSFPIQLKLHTSLVGEKINNRDSYLCMHHDKPTELVLRISNEIFESLYKAFNEDGMRVFIEFTAYKSMSKSYVEMYNFSSLDFQILEAEEFSHKMRLMMFLEIMDTDIF